MHDYCLDDHVRALYVYMHPMHLCTITASMIMYVHSMYMHPNPYAPMHDYRLDDHVHAPYARSRGLRQRHKIDNRINYGRQVHMDMRKLRAP